MYVKTLAILLVILATAVGCTPSEQGKNDDASKATSATEEGSKSK